MSKKAFGTAPKPKQPTDDQILAFERGGKGHDTPVKSKPVEPIKRLSLDLPQSLHTRFKIACTATGLKMSGEVLAFIEKRTAELESETP
jgi:hypothetical protein